MSIGAAALGVTVATVTLLFARGVVTPPKRRAETGRILAVDNVNGTITLSSHPDSLLPGRYGLWFGGGSGFAKVGSVVAIRGSEVIRELLAVEAGHPAPGMRWRMTGWFYRDPAELGYPTEEVNVPTELGGAPAWVVPAASEETATGRWVIQVHGRAVDRTETIRAVPVFREAGFASLLISYRNDGQAPRSDDGLYALGDTEWRDVDAAIEYAITCGARDIVLMGWSMGGATVLQAATRSQHHRLISGVVLESPVVDWVTALDHQAGLRRIPRVISVLAYRILSRPWGRVVTGQSVPVDLKRLDFVNRAMELRIPILLLHSAEDAYVPDTASRALATARPDIVTAPLISGAGHTRIWNYDPDAWNQHIRNWLDRL